MTSTIEENKNLVLRFNKECIEQGSMESMTEIVAPDAINHSAPSGGPTGPESFTAFIFNILRKAFKDLKVEILDQVAEGDRVTTRKIIHGIHAEELFGIPATDKPVRIQIIDIIRIKDGQYQEHWGQSNFSEVLQELAQA